MATVEAGSLEDEFELSLSAAVGTLAQKKEAKDLSSTKLDKVTHAPDCFFLFTTFIFFRFTNLLAFQTLYTLRHMSI